MENTYERICKIFQKEGVDIGQPLALTDNSDLIANLLSKPGRVTFFDSYKAKSIVANNPWLKAIPLDTQKKIIIYMVFRKEARENRSATWSYYNYINQKRLLPS